MATQTGIHKRITSGSVLYYALYCTPYYGFSPDTSADFLVMAYQLSSFLVHCCYTSGGAATSALEDELNSTPEDLLTVLASAYKQWTSLHPGQSVFIGPLTADNATLRPFPMAWLYSVDESSPAPPVFERLLDVFSAGNEFYTSPLFPLHSLQSNTHSLPDNFLLELLEYDGSSTPNDLFLTPNNSTYHTDTSTLSIWCPDQDTAPSPSHSITLCCGAAYSDNAASHGGLACLDLPHSSVWAPFHSLLPSYRLLDRFSPPRSGGLCGTRPWLLHCPSFDIPPGDPGMVPPPSHSCSQSLLLPLHNFLPFSAPHWGIWSLPPKLAHIALPNPSLPPLAA